MCADGRTLTPKALAKLLDDLNLTDSEEARICEVDRTAFVHWRSGFRPLNAQVRKLLRILERYPGMKDEIREL